ncbi:MAG: CHAT domain-containing protein [Planctomycetes bacterium]|nr:CHAT domain-containing protein [Planctomycetota bacterium]
MLLALLLTVWQGAAPTGEPCDSRLATFREALDPMRRGDADARRRMLESAELLSTDCGRPECLAVAKYYAALDADALAAGLALEARVKAVRDDFNAAHDRELDVAAWRSALPAWIAELDALAEAGEREPDWTAGLRARSTAARLRIALVKLDLALAPEERNELVVRAGRDLDLALAGFERAGQLGSTLEPRWLSARLAQMAGARSDARELFERCAADALHVGAPTYAVHAQEGLIGVARDGGDLGAEERALAALARLTPGEQTWSVTRDWAVLLLSADHTREAWDYLERHAPSEDAVADRADWHFVAGAAALRARRLDAARTHLAAATAGRADAGAVLLLARLELVSGRPAAAEDLIESSLASVDLDFSAEAQRHALLGEAAFVQGRLPRARDELTQALAVARSWEAFIERSPLSPSDPRDATNVIGEWLGVHSVALLAATHARAGDPLEAARVIEELQSRGLRKSGTPGAELRSLAGLAVAELTTDDVRAWAASHEAGLVTWVLGPDFGEVVHVSAAGRATAARIELGRAELADLARRFEEALLDTDEEWRATLARELARLLFPEPVASALAAERDDAALLCLPHGVIEGLALERVELAGRALEDRFVLSVLPGLVAPRPREARPIARWSFLGAPSGSRARELPSARAELERLAANAGGSRLALGDACTREALLAALTDGGALHVATHALNTGSDAGGRFAPIGLEVSGGDLVGADELRRRAGALELVVLSSCASAHGRMLDSEGLHGIARAFLEAGARDVVATLRPVGDRAAHDFALAFQRRLADGASRAEAVRGARRELAERGHRIADWSAFRLLGQD